MQDNGMPKAPKSTEKELAYHDAQVFKNDEDEVFCEEHAHVQKALVVLRDHLPIIFKRPYCHASHQEQGDKLNWQPETQKFLPRSV